jgi:hypothetical protein
MADKLTLNLFAMEDKLWTECYMRVAAAISANPEGLNINTCNYAAQTADQFVRDFRDRRPGKDSPEIGG